MKILNKWWDNLIHYSKAHLVIFTVHLKPLILNYGCIKIYFESVLFYTWIEKNDVDLLHKTFSYVICKFEGCDSCLETDDYLILHYSWRGKSHPLFEKKAKKIFKGIS